MCSADDLVIWLSIFNGYVDGHTGGFYGDNGGYGVGQSNSEGRMLLKFSLEKELCVSNTMFKGVEKRKRRMVENTA